MNVSFVGRSVAFPDKPGGGVLPQCDGSAGHGENWGWDLHGGFGHNLAKAAELRDGGFVFQGPRRGERDASGALLRYIGGKMELREENIQKKRKELSIQITILGQSMP